MKWLVQITGDDFDLNELSKSLKDPELNLIKKDNQYYLKSIQFYQLKEASEVKDKAEEIMNIINGVSRLVIGTRNSFKVGSIVRINDDGTQTALVSFSDVAIGRDSFSATKISNDGSVETVNPADSVPGFFNIAQNSNSVATVFRLLCVKGYTWVNLYRIYEIIEKDVGSLIKIVEKEWTTKKEIKRFKHTANSPSVLGEDARHGEENTQPPLKPMTLLEARQFIEKLIHNWISTKS